MTHSCREFVNVFFRPCCQKARQPGDQAARAAQCSSAPARSVLIRSQSGQYGVYPITRLQRQIPPAANFLVLNVLDNGQDVQISMCRLGRHGANTASTVEYGEIRGNRHGEANLSVHNA
jgi:hypothetical protein